MKTFLIMFTVADDPCVHSRIINSRMTAQSIVDSFMRANVEIHLVGIYEMNLVEVERCANGITSA